MLPEKAAQIAITNYLILLQATERMDYTIIGSNVNLASRIQAQAKPGGILISHATWALVKSDFPLTAAGDLEAKGFYKKVKIYQMDELNLTQPG